MLKFHEFTEAGSVQRWAGAQVVRLGPMAASEMGF